MFWIVSYDIPSNRRRRKVSIILEGFGRRVQYSVFECTLDDKKIDRLEKRLRNVIDDDEDDIRMYPISQANLERVRLLGRAVLYQPKDYIII